MRSQYHQQSIQLKGVQQVSCFNEGLDFFVARQLFFFGGGGGGGGGPTT